MGWTVWGLILCRGKRFFPQNVSNAFGVSLLSCGCKESNFFPPCKAADLVRGLKISGAIPPLPYTSCNGVQRDIIMILYFWFVYGYTTYSVRVKVH